MPLFRVPRDETGAPMSDYSLSPAGEKFAIPEES